MTDEAISTAQVRKLCAQPQHEPLSLPEGLAPGRAYAIRLAANKWVNQTVLHYCFLLREDWDWPEAQRNVVRNAFATWKALGIGLSFVETTAENDADILIGRLQDGRSWSYVGTDIRNNRDQGRTMNFGWDLTTAWGGATALHEIGHTLGLQHEHQNPLAGIVWDEEAVYTNLLQTNGWDRQTTYDNIISKLASNSVEGSNWDPTSIMHYPFEPGLLKLPHPYDRTGIGENMRLSELDKQWALHWYPTPAEDTPIQPMSVSPLPLAAGLQRDFVFEPVETRDYTVQTVGNADTRVVLFEDREGEARHLAAADDAGTDSNASITANFVAGRRYHIRVRLAHLEGDAPAGLTLR